MNTIVLMKRFLPLLFILPLLLWVGCEEEEQEDQQTFTPTNRRKKGIHIRILSGFYFRSDGSLLLA